MTDDTVPKLMFLIGLMMGIISGIRGILGSDATTGYVLASYLLLLAIGFKIFQE